MHLHKERQFMQIPKASVWAMALVMGLGSVAAVAQPATAKGRAKAPTGPSRGMGWQGSGPKHQQGPRMHRRSLPTYIPTACRPGRPSAWVPGPTTNGSRAAACRCSTALALRGDHWRGLGLRQPPRTTMQHGGDYLLVAIGSGVTCN